MTADAGIASLPKPGSNVKILDDFLHASEPVFTVQAVEGQSASVDGFEQTVDVVKLIFAPNPGWFSNTHQVVAREVRLAWTLHTLLLFRLG